MGSRRLIAFSASLSLCVLAACTAAPQAPSGTAAATPGANQTLTVGVAADPGASILGFNRPTNIVGRRATILLFDGLFELSYDDPSQPLHVVPGLATSWDISNDGLVYTFHLRKSVQFQDGTPFDAQAVLFNFRMLLDPTFEYFDKNAAASARGTTSATIVDSYRVVDDATFEMKLTKPFAGVLDEWAQPSPTPVWIVSPAAIKQYGVDGFPAHPVGTGPFKLETYQKGESVVFTRNDAYFKGPAAVKTIAWRILTDPTARAVALESGQVQIAEDISVQYKDQWQGRSDIDVQVTTAPNSYACWLNSQTGVMASTEARRAVSLAVNRQQINELVMHGAASIPSGYFSPGTLAYSKDDPALPYDNPAALAAIQRLGLKGATLTYETTTALGDPGAWDVVNRNLSDAGLTPVQRTLDLATWLGDYQRLPAAGVDMACGQMGSDSMMQVYQLLGPGGWPKNPPLDAAYDQLLNSSRTYDELVANMRGVNKLLAQDVVALFILTNPRVNAMSKAVDWHPAQAYCDSLYTARYK